MALATLFYAVLALLFGVSWGQLLKHAPHLLVGMHVVGGTLAMGCSELLPKGNPQEVGFACSVAFMLAGLVVGFHGTRRRQPRSG